MHLGSLSRACSPTRWFTGFVAGALISYSASAAFISEIDLSSPAGQAIEFSDLDPASEHTLLVIDANPFSASNFGLVLGVVALPAGTGVNGVAMVSDTAWPGEPWRTTPVPSLPPPTDPDTLGLNFSRLLVVMEGAPGINRFNHLMNDPSAQALYDASAVTDWLVLGDGDNAPFYQSNGHDIDAINTALGIDLLTRLVDKSSGSVVGRTNRPGEVIDHDVFFVGEPDGFGQFSVDPDFNYVYTPGLSNVPLVPVDVPEPGTAGAVGLGLLLLHRRRRDR